MNIPLLESWLDPFPSQIDHTVPDTQVSAIRFSRQGSLLAGACSNGSILVWDVATMTVLRAFHAAHAGPVQAVSWSRSGRYLASGGADWQAFVWDVSTGQAVAEYRFDSPVTHVAFHPIKRNTLLVSLAKSIPVLVSTDDPTLRTPLFASVPHDHASAAAADPNETNSLEQLDVLATWGPLGRFILCGTSKGHWTVLSAHSLQPVFSDKLAASAIREFALSPCGNHLAITVADKTIRVYLLPYVQSAAAVSATAAADAGELAFECVPLHKLQDLVNRYPWTGAAFTSRGEYVIGATAGRTHALCIWGREHGQLVKLLEGPNEGMVSFAWHPTLPMCITVTHSGLLSVWNTTPKDKWSAFAPDFKEIEDNIEYEEQEDEFDLDPLADDPLVGKLELFRGPNVAAQVSATAAIAAGGSALPRSRSAVLDLVTVDDSKDPTAALAKRDPDADFHLPNTGSWAVAVRLEDMASLPGYDQQYGHHPQHHVHQQQQQHQHHHHHHLQDGGFGGGAGGLVPGQVVHPNMVGEQSTELMASLASSAMGLVTVQKEDGVGKGSKRKRDE